MRISTGNFDSFFISLNYALFELRNLIEIKDTTETVRQSCFSCQRKSSETAQQKFLTLAVMKDIMCRYAYPQEILIQFFFGITPFFTLEILPKSKILCRRNSTEKAQQNCLKLCCYEGHNV